MRVSTFLLIAVHLASVYARKKYASFSDFLNRPSRALGSSTHDAKAKPGKGQQKGSEARGRTDSKSAAKSSVSSVSRLGNLVKLLGKLSVGAGVAAGGVFATKRLIEFFQESSRSGKGNRKNPRRSKTGSPGSTVKVHSKDEGATGPNAKSKSIPSSGDVNLNLEYDSNAGVLELLSSNSSSSPALVNNLNSNAEVDSLGKKYLCLVFDCEVVGSESTDQSARLDFFTLMNNLTSAASLSGDMTAVYVPGSEHHVFEDSNSKSKSEGWRLHYLTGSPEGRARAKALRKKFDVKETELRIVMLDASDPPAIISDNALDMLRLSPRGMPWPQTAIMDKIGTEFLGANGGPMESLDLRSNSELDLIGWYFSASWCKPCESFHPKLQEAYYMGMDEAGKQNGGVEIVYVSLDQDEEAFKKHSGKMPWPSVPFRDVRRALLQIGFNIKSIPALVFTDREGRLVTSSGVSEIASKSPASFESIMGMGMGRVMDLGSEASASMEVLQRQPVLLVLADRHIELTDTKAQALQILRKLSMEDSAAPVLIPRSSRADVSFGIVDSSPSAARLGAAFRSLCSLAEPDSGSDSPLQILLIDLANEKYAYSPVLSSEASVLENTARQLLRQYRDFALEMKPMVRVSAANAESESLDDEADESREY